VGEIAKTIENNKKLLSCYKQIDFLESTAVHSSWRVTRGLGTRSVATGKVNERSTINDDECFLVFVAQAI